MKNIRPIILGVLCAVALALGSTARATTLVIGDSHELGFVEFGIPSGDSDRTDYVNAMISLPLGGSTHVVRSGQDNLVTRSLNNFGSLPQPAVFGVNGTSTSIDIGSGIYSYLFAKYDGPNYGAEVWFIGDLSGTITIPATGGKYGLSGWTLFGPGGGSHVPDGGTTAALLGLGLSSLAAIRAKFGKI
jgi:VPDSG-CTERM motif